MLDESMVISKAQAGDRDALNTLMSDYWHPIYRFVSYKIGSLEDAQEITQETFLRAFRSLPKYQQTTASFKTYLCRIALNLITDFWRKKGRSPVLINLAEYQDIVSIEDQPDVQAINHEQQKEIAEVLKSLPEDQRQTIELRIIAGLPIKQTALAMGKTEAAIKMLQQRALKNLRTLLLERGLVDFN